MNYLLNEVDKSQVSTPIVQVESKDAHIGIEKHRSTCSINTETVGCKTPLDCPICYNEYPHEQIQSPLPCKHYFCLSCLKEYLESRMESFQVLNVPCPYAGCKEIFSIQAIKLILDEKQYKAYNELVLNKIANRDFKNKFCPKPGCSKSFTTKINQEFTVCVCETKICNTCHNFWHEGKSCLEVLDQDLELYSKDNEVRFCVMCKTLTKRDEGCIHITCPVCDYDWCWNCGREYKSKHSCPRYWSPTAPASNNGFLLMELYKKTWNKGSFMTKIYLASILILASPFLMIWLLLFWPLFIERDTGNELSFKHPVKSFCTIITALIFGVLTLPLTLLLILCYACFIVLIQLPINIVCVIIRLIKGQPIFDNNSQKSHKKRWQIGDPTNFVFRPIEIPVQLETGALNVENAPQILSPEEADMEDSESKVSEDF